MYKTRAKDLCVREGDRAIFDNGEQKPSRLLNPVVDTVDFPRSVYSGNDKDKPLFPPLIVPDRG